MEFLQDFQHYGGLIFIVGQAAIALYATVSALLGKKSASKSHDRQGGGR